jgi:hypothetical protein
MVRRLSSCREWLGAKTSLLVVFLLVVAAAGGAWAVLHSGSARGAVQITLPNPPTDLLALGQGTGQTPATVPVQHNAEPPLTATPPAVCGPGSNPLTGVPDGRVPASALSAPAAAKGYTCNLSVVSHQGHSGGFKVLRYIDTHGHECAFYDTALLFPTNAVQLGGTSLGVAVLDMSDPAHPVQTDTLTEPPMMSPHESLSINTRRGLLAAVLGNPATAPGLVSIYDASADCRHPVLDSTALVARFGHEGNFSADGNTFYAAGTSVQSITAIDVTDPKHPHPIWQGSEYSHGLTLSDDGNRAYVADPINGQLLILDTSQIQARKPNPQVSEISRLAWNSSTIPQNAIPMTIHGHPYLLEFDEYAFRFSSPAPPDTVGAARIIDISDERHPFVVSNLRLQVDQPAEHHAASGDPGTLDPAQSYAAHYCNIPREVDPEIVACSFITSGLRVFNISDPLHPREVGYFVAPPQAQPENGYNGSNFAMSKPAFAPERREVWYTDGGSGFYDLHLDASAWPDATSVSTPSCAAPTGRLGGSQLGPIALRQKRTAARTALSQFSTRRRLNMDFFCLAGGGIRAGYPSAKLLRSLPRAQRRRFRGRVVLALTSDHFYALRGVEPATRLSTARRTLHLLWHFTIGRNRWYVVRGTGGAHGILKVRHGVVEEIGIAPSRLTRTRRQSRRFMASFD